MNIKIPEEYKAFDYGFSGIDEPQPTASPTVQTVPTGPALDTLLLDSHNKLDQILAALQSTSSQASGTDVELRAKIHSLEAIIVPLLNNLLKTADKDYIYWPNRREVIETQLQKVLQITRG